MPLNLKSLHAYMSIKELSSKLMRMQQQEKAKVLLFIVSYIHCLSNDEETSEFVDILINPYRHHKRDLAIMHHMLEQGRLYKENGFKQMKHTISQDDAGLLNYMKSHLDAHAVLSTTIGAELTPLLRKSVYKIWEQLLSAHLFLPEALEELKQENDLSRAFAFGSQADMLFDDSITLPVAGDILKKFPFASYSLDEYLRLHTK